MKTQRRPSSGKAHQIVFLWALATAVCAVGATPPVKVMTRGPLNSRRLALVFTGHEYAEGGSTILDELTNRRAKASFFLTGDFLENEAFKPLVRRVVRDGHYLGPHSDKHLLYCEWTTERKTLVTRERFASDLRANLEKITAFGVARPTYFLPPFEHFNSDIARWTTEEGLTLINYTPGTRSHADYTTDGSREFVSSQTIYDSILAFERKEANGLNGFLLLLHIGSGPQRTDKFHSRLGALLEALTAKHYTFARVDELLNGPRD